MPRRSHRTARTAGKPGEPPDLVSPFLWLPAAARRAACAAARPLAATVDAAASTDGATTESRQDRSKTGAQLRPSCRRANWPTAIEDRRQRILAAAAGTDERRFAENLIGTSLPTDLAVLFVGTMAIVNRSVMPASDPAPSVNVPITTTSPQRAIAARIIGNYRLARGIRS